MFRYNLKLVFRRLLKDRLFTMLNLLGLSTGLAAAILIYLWVHDEYSMNSWFDKKDQLYQVMSNFKTSRGLQTFDKTPVPLPDALLKDMPEVEHAVPVNDFFGNQSREEIITFGDNHFHAKGYYAGRDFFHVFSYQLVEGDKDYALADVSSIVLSETIAIKIFNSPGNAIGKTVQWNDAFFKGVYKVTGVVKTPPGNTTDHFDYLLNIGVLVKNDRYAGNWTNDYGDTYVILKKGTDIAGFNKKILHYLQAKNPGLRNQSLFAQKFSDKYLYGNYENGMPAGGRVSYVKLFSIVALFILLIACINFMNLSTAQATGKIKEVGVRKSIGAARLSLVFQFLFESTLVALLSMLVAIALVVFILPEFNSITGKQIRLQDNMGALIPVLAISLVTGFVSGCYPAFYLSGFKPVAVLKGRLKASLSNLWLRKSLVIAQFATTIVFIIGFLVVHQQINYTRTKNLGYDKDNVVCFTWKGELYNQWNGLLQGKSNAKFEIFMQRLNDVPGVVHAANIVGNILDRIPGQGGVSWTGQASEKDYAFQSPVVGFNFTQTLGIPIKEGRTFSKAYHDDYSKIMLNEAAVEMMKLKDPVGKKIDMNGDKNEIIGVVKDFHYGSLHNSIEPLILRCDPTGSGVLVKIEAGKEQSTIAGLQKLYAEYLPGYSFEYTFMDEDYQAQYTSELRVAALSRYFAILAILISCLGLFGLAAYSAQKRQKEISIRKVLGAGVFNLSVMLSRDFIKLVFFSILIALPIGWWSMHTWLESFAEKVKLSWWYFVLPSLLALLITLITVSFQVIRAAIANPVKHLKNE